MSSADPLRFASSSAFFASSRTFSALFCARTAFADFASAAVTASPLVASLSSMFSNTALFAITFSMLTADFCRSPSLKVLSVFNAFRILSTFPPGISQSFPAHISSPCTFLPAFTPFTRPTEYQSVITKPSNPHSSLSIVVSRP